MNMSKAAVQAIEYVHGTKYKYGEISQLVGQYYYNNLKITRDSQPQKHNSDYYDCVIVA